MYLKRQIFSNIHTEVLICTLDSNTIFMKLNTINTLMTPKIISQVSLLSCYRRDPFVYLMCLLEHFTNMKCDITAPSFLQYSSKLRQFHTPFNPQPSTYSSVPGLYLASTNSNLVYLIGSQFSSTSIFSSKLHRVYSLKHSQ
jgi:hypothetical protein